MIAKILPLIFLLVGTGGGIGAGLFLAPGSSSRSESDKNAVENSRESTEDANAPKANSRDPMTDSQGNPIDSSATEFVKMSNQFVIPVVKNDQIEALVVVTLSLETRNGISEEIYRREPKLRDAFLRVLFDHSNMGGFHGVFTTAETMDLLRTALREVAQKEIGPDLVDVLIVDIIRQDT